jgi:hypothetical protein
VAAALVLVGVGGAVWNVVRPYANVSAPWARDVACHLRGQVRPEDQIVVRQGAYDSATCLRWQLLSFKEQLRYGGEVDWARLEKTGGRLWYVDHAVDEVRPPYEGPAPIDGRELLPEEAAARWHEVEQGRFTAKLLGAEQVYLCWCYVHLLERGQAARSGLTKLPSP